MSLSSPLLFTLLALTPFALAANKSATAEADILWPLPGSTFSLNPKGMGAIFALQNRAEAEKHGYWLTWQMCTSFSSHSDRRECAFYEANYDKDDPRDANAPTVLQVADDTSDVYIEMSHSYWYNDITGNTNFAYNLSGVYEFSWNFQMGPWCTKTDTSSTYAIGRQIADGAFNVTIDNEAPYPTMTPSSCAKFLGAVSYTNSFSDWTFGQSADNEPTCVGTASVTESPEPCRATLDAGQIGSVLGVMGWADASPTESGTTATETSGGRRTGSPTESPGRSPDSSPTTAGADSIGARVAAVFAFSMVATILAL